MLSTRLHELQIDTDTSAAPAGDSDIVEMQQELSKVQKDYELLGDRFKRINIVNDQVGNWAKRVYGKFGSFTDDPIFQQEPTDIVKIFNAMADCTGNELRNIKEERKGGVADAAADFMDDEYSEFNNEEYRLRNVRLRPQSGLTHGDETRDGRASNISRGAGGEGGGDDAENDRDKLDFHELNMQRNKVKMRLQ